MSADTDQLRVAALIHTLTRRMRIEQDYWIVGTASRCTIDHAIAQLEFIAHEAALGAIDIDAADAFADAGEITLRQIIRERRHEP
jgi:hypothetical protein